MAQDISIAPGELPTPSAHSEPEIVYHYTGVGGLRGIIENGSLWASDVWFMNDTREARYGFVVMTRVLSAIEEDAGFRHEVREEALRFITGLSDRPDVNHSYIACMSYRGDQLSQWRAYGRPRGFSVGFDRAELQRIYPPQLPELGKAVYRVIEYEESTQNAMFRDFFDLAVSDSQKISNAEHRAVVAATQFIQSSLMLAPAFKDPAFSEEEEVRLQVYGEEVSKESLHLKFRDGAMGLTPYIELSLKQPDAENMTAIRKVTVGPQPNQVEALKATEQLLRRYGYDAVEVIPSVVPLRP